MFDLFASSRLRFTVSLAPFLFLLAVGLASCARAPLHDATNALRSSAAPLPLSDDLDLKSLADALDEHLAKWGEIKPEAELTFGAVSVSKSDYAQHLRALSEYIRTHSHDDVIAFIRANYSFLEVYGSKRWGETYLTGYYEPLIAGSLTPTTTLSQPLYRKPTDILSLNLSNFGTEFSSARKMRARIEQNRVLPYYGRAEIDSENKLAGRHLEICYVDPIDAFFLHIQGSGTVRLEDGGQVRLNYAEKNGHPYIAIGVAVMKRLGTKTIDAHTLEEYLRSLSAEQLAEVLNLNPSYVFFEIGKKNAVTSSGVPATGGRTIATDPAFFPKGGLAFLAFKKPIFPTTTATVPTEWQPVGRFVVDQDSGGAIKGPGRTDLFVGQGALAKQLAGVIKQEAQLYYLIPNKLPTPH